MFLKGIRRLFSENDQYKTAFEITNAILFLRLRNLSAELVHKIKQLRFLFTGELNFLKRILESFQYKMVEYYGREKMFFTCKLVYTETKTT